MYCDDSKEACEWHSEKEDIVQKIKELMESEEGTYIDSLIFVADKTVSFILDTCVGALLKKGSMGFCILFI